MIPNVTEGMEQGLARVVREAKKLCPVDTGELRGSIRAEVNKFETTHEVAAKERHRKKPSKKDGEKRREEKLRGRKRVVSENKAATAQKGKALRHGKGFRGR